MKDKYDVIIIGAGIGGLVCGCYLAKAGLKVLIIEKNEKVGGCVCSRKIANFTFDMGAHVIGGCDRHGLLHSFLKKLKIDVDFIKLKPFDRFNFGNKVVLEVPDNLTQYIHILQKKFPNESKQIDFFFHEMVKIYRYYLLNQAKIIKYASVTYQEFLNNIINNRKLQRILSGQCLYIGLPPEYASLIAMSFMMVSYLRDGMYYTKGGTQNLADSLSKQILRYSGDVLCGTAVQNIKIERHYARAITTDKGNLIEGNVVVSNIDATKTFLKLVGADKLRDSFVRKLTTMKRGASLLQLHLALDIPGESLKEISGWHYGDTEFSHDIESVFYVFIPNVFDETIAPKGKTIMQVLKLVSTFPPIRRNRASIRKEMRNTIIKKLQKISGQNVKNKIIMEFLSTPEDIEEFTANSGGSAFGWEMSPSYILDNRLDSETPFKNLFLTGHWTNPGCGVLGVATSGMNTGRKILKKIYGQEI